MLIRSDRRSVVSYINHQGGLFSKRICKLANDLLVSDNLGSLWQSLSRPLFVGFGNYSKGGPVMKQIISRWLVDAITLEFFSLRLQCPIGFRAHSTRGIASSWAWSSGVSISDICEAAGWSSTSTFARFYNMDVPAWQARVFSA